VVGPIQEDGDGSYHFIYTSPATAQSGRVRILVEAGSGEAVVVDHLAVQLTEPPPPPRPEPWLSLGPWAGVTSNFARMTYLSFSLEGVLRLPFAADYLYLALEGGYRFGKDNSETRLTGTSLETRLDVLPLHLSVMAKFLPGSDLNPYAGIGGGLEFVSWSLRPGEGPLVQGHRTLPGAVAYAGCELRAGPGSVFVQVRYLYAYLDRDGEDGSRIIGNIGGMEAGLGYRLEL
jgi:hypothetical protein